MDGRFGMSSVGDGWPTWGTFGAPVKVCRVVTRPSRQWQLAVRLAGGLALVVGGCSGSPAEPSEPVAASELTGSYVISFTHEHPSSNPWHSCQRVSLNMTTTSWLPIDCDNPDVTPVVQPAGVVVRNDSLFLKVVPLPGTRDIILSYLVGTPDRVNAKWVGATCASVGGSGVGLCVREFGSAQLRRP